jgi:NAD(P)-dependent dehydrogenase (short-subunit alcohol dehydrogenase family)
MGNYLVIGATSGIGESVSQKLKSESHRVFAASRDTKGNANQFENFQKIDVSEDFQLELPDALDGLVYCPGTINLKPYRRIDKNELIKDFQINLIGGFEVLKQAIPALKKGNNPSAVFFSTVAVGTGMPFHSSVAASKGAVEGMVRAMSAELAPTIRVNAIAPSLTDTPLAENLLSNDKKREMSIDRHPLKRISTADEVASLTQWLLGDDSLSMTGQIIKLDGGMSAIR